MEQQIIDEEVKKEIYTAANEYATGQVDPRKVSKHHFVSGAVWALGNKLVQNFLDQENPAKRDNTMKHTPGPWLMTNNCSGKIEVITSDKQFVAHIGYTGQTPESQRLANARLISCAPEMLEALEKIANWELPETGKFWDREQKEPMSYEAAFGTNGSRDYFKQLAQSIISKAKGEQP